MSDTGFESLGIGTSEFEDTGVALYAIELTVNSTHPLKQWNAFFSGMGLTGKTVTKKTGELDIVALPDRFNPGDFFANGHFHPPSKKDDIDSVYWIMSYRRSPSETPPTEVKRLSKKLGGLDGLMLKLEEHWPFGLVDAEVEVSYLVNSQRWRFGPFNSLNEWTVSQKNFEPSFSLKYGKWEIEPPIEGLSSITYSRLKKESLVLIRVEGKFPVNFKDRNLFEGLRQTVWRSLRKCLTDGQGV